ncbi:class I SAM-dependent methyltransferase [Saccharopolyspora elongata]|uniref:Class I SAM-dependent methyltransferase n=1 Tax=Saccharopolyspora elongata TaxID=2530387 RepID=A0A4R4Z5W3_9PSEU|nr:class I SAM-dependent methyltransferase [Saccharopolyspora elongata]
MPRALLWDHNAHYHPWLLRQVPQRCSRVLDVGCGTGALVRQLVERVEFVDGVDVSAEMIDQASARTSATNVRWLRGDVLDADLDLHPEGYDAVTALSSLHHMPLRPGLARLASLLRPGGVLAVIGLYREESAADFAMAAASFSANAAVGTYLATRGRAGKPHDEGMPVRDASATLTEISDAAREVLPGAQVRRRLFWRHSLLWRKPA